MSLSRWDYSIWIIEGPEVGYRLGGVCIPCPTRATVVKLASGGLWVHSPVQWDNKLTVALSELGRVEALIAPSSYHHIHVPAWAEQYPDAEVLCTPNLVKTLAQTGAVPLLNEGAQKWADEIDHRLVDLDGFQEIIFFHHQSKTLIVTDLMQNFETSRVKSPFTKFLLIMGGATGPNGKPSLEIRRAARRYRENLREAINQAIDWNPAQIILSHGLSYRSNAIAELTRAFTWL